MDFTKNGGYISNHHQPSGGFDPLRNGYDKYIASKLAELYKLYMKNTIVYVYTKAPLKGPLLDIVNMLMYDADGPDVRLKHPNQIDESTFRIEPKDNLNIIEIPIWYHTGIQIAIRFCTTDNDVSRCDIRYYHMEDVDVVTD